MKTRLVLLALSFILSFCAPALAASFAPSKTNGAESTPRGVSSDDSKSSERHDRHFVVEVLKINHNEGVIANLMAERAVTREVGDLARQLVSDLDAATRELQALAEKKNIALPEPRSEAGDLKTWNEKDQKSLDADYLKRVKKILDELADLYGKAAEKSADPEIVAFAKKLHSAVREQRLRADRVRPTPAPAPTSGPVR
jgi:predicted outer membrane protein